MNSFVAIIELTSRKLETVCAALYREVLIPKSIYTMTIGTRLRKCRERKRLSQREVAEHLGVSQTTYCNWECDVASFQVKYLLPLAQLFEVSILEITPEDTGLTSQL